MAIVLSLPSFSFSEASALKIVTYIAGGLGLGLAVGSLFTLFIKSHGNMGSDAKVFWWIVVIFYYPLVAVFTWLVSGLDMSAANLGTFALGHLIALPSSLLVYPLAKIGEGCQGC